MTIKANLLLENLSHQLVCEGSRYWNFLFATIPEDVNNKHTGEKHEASDNEIRRVIHGTCYISDKVRFFCRSSMVKEDVKNYSYLPDENDGNAIKSFLRLVLKQCAVVEPFPNLWHNRHCC